MSLKNNNPSWKHIHLTNTWQEFEFHCVAVLLPYHWSSWTVYVQQIPNYDTAWFYDLKPAASSNTVSEKWRQQRFNSRLALHWGQIHTTTESKKSQKIREKSCISPFLFVCLRNLSTWLTNGNRHAVCLHQSQSKSIDKQTITQGYHQILSISS